MQGTRSYNKIRGWEVYSVITHLQFTYAISICTHTLTLSLTPIFLQSLFGNPLQSIRTSSSIKKASRTIGTILAQYPFLAVRQDGCFIQLCTNMYIQVDKGSKITKLCQNRSMQALLPHLLCLLNCEPFYCCFDQPRVNRFSRFPQHQRNHRSFLWIIMPTPCTVSTGYHAGG